LSLYEQLRTIQGNLLHLGPEFFLVGLFIVYLVAELLLTSKKGVQETERLLHGGLLLCSLPLGILLVGQWFTPEQPLFGEMLYLDRKAVFFKILVTLAWVITLIHTRSLRYRFPLEINAILLVALVGLYFLTMATHFLLIYLSIEIVSFCSYMLVAVAPGKRSSEAAIKYLLFGAVSSAIMLYGISLIYGLSGTFAITNPQLGDILSLNTPVVYYVALFMTIGGFLFKLSLAPFHLWTPDVYEATPTPLVSFLSVAPKAAVLLVLMRLVTVLPLELLSLLGGVALLSITMGNVGALWQKNAKRMLAYSTIAQAGYLLVGLVAYNQQGFEAAVFYASTYVLINMAVFYGIDVLSSNKEAVIHDYAGKGRKYIASGIAMTLLMVALTGLPPTVGFTAKWLVFSSLWGSFQSTGLNWQLVLIIGGLLNATIALAYYVKIPYQLFFKDAPQNELSTSEKNPLVQWIFAFLTALVIALFFQPAWLLEYINLL
jgi:NADH-quinone oxidoreductase subunit N